MADATEVVEGSLASSEEGSDTGSSEGSNTEEEGDGDDKSCDGDDRDKDRHSGGGDGRSDAASSPEATIRATTLMKVFMDMPKDTIRKHFHYIIELADGKGDTQALMNSFKPKAVSIYNSLNKSRDKVENYEKEERAIAEARAIAKSRAEKLSLHIMAR